MMFSAEFETVYINKIIIINKYNCFVLVKNKLVIYCIYIYFFLPLFR